MDGENGIKDGLPMQQSRRQRAIQEIPLPPKKAKQRGQLRIYLGMAVGVGKTYAMLRDAKLYQEEGADVLIGCMKRDTNPETLALLEGMRVLAPRVVMMDGLSYEVCDIDAILKRNPDIVVVDDTPHTNPSICRHRKRWQGIEEVLRSGIDVWTAMNIQNIESLNGVVERVTGVTVHETVPDYFIARADSVRLVDIPPDDLLRRVQEGKVRLKGRRQVAYEHYFKKSTLVALRELSLRYLAGRMERQMRTNSEDALDQTVQDINFGTLLVLERKSERAIRRIMRYAQALAVNARVVWWKSLDTQVISDQRIGEILGFAKRLGAQVDILSGDIATEITRYARRHNLSMVAIVSARETLYQRLIRQQAPRLNFLSLAQAQHCTPKYRLWWDQVVQNCKTSHWRGYLVGVAVTMLCFFALLPLQNLLEPTNHAMIYLLGVLYTALQFGSGPAVLSAILSVLAFNLSVIAPFWSFHVYNSQYLITFVAMLVVGVVTGQGVAKIRRIAKAANWRRHQTRVLFEVARDFSQVLSEDEALRILHDTLHQHLHIESEFWEVAEKDSGKREHLTCYEKHLLGVNSATVRWVYQHQRSAGAGTDTLVLRPFWYIPCHSGADSLGVMVVTRPRRSGTDDPMDARLVEALVTLFAQTLLRLKATQEAKQTLVSMEADRLRHSLLQSLSHDLRTPITMFKMLSESIASRLQGYPQASLLNDVQKLVDSSTRMERLVGNLLEMARLQTGSVHIHKDWILVDDIFTSACKEVGDRLQGYHIERLEDEDVAFIYADEVLLVRVLTNLLDNAVKYCPKGSTIQFQVQRQGAVVALRIADNGPGLPPGDPQRLFAPFRRGQKENHIMGVGLGLAICHTIARVHGGDITAQPSEMGGAAFTLTLPYREMPDLEDEDRILEQQEQNTQP